MANGGYGEGSSGRAWSLGGAEGLRSPSQDHTVALERQTFIPRVDEFQHPRSQPLQSEVSAETLFRELISRVDYGKWYSAPSGRCAMYPGYEGTTEVLPRESLTERLNPKLLSNSVLKIHLIIHISKCIHKEVYLGVGYNNRKPENPRCPMIRDLLVE